MTFVSFLSLIGILRHSSCILRVLLWKALIQPACFAGAISWLTYVVTIFMGHENGDNKGQPRGNMCKMLVD